MEEALHQSMLCQVEPTPATGTVDKSLLGAVKTEMTLFESRGVKGCSLQLIYNNLMSISPASVESE